jgi:multidrug efflux pump subunit AcrB
MRRVTTISLNGNSYQIEEAGYEALWAAILTLIAVYTVLVSPLHALYRTPHYAYGSLAAAFGGLIWTAFLLVGLWAVWHYWPELHQLLPQLLGHGRPITTQLGWS